MITLMQKFYTPKDHPHNVQKTSLAAPATRKSCTPSGQVTHNLMAYAMALQVIDTRLMGKLYLLVN